MEIKTELSRSELRYQCYAMRDQGKCDPKHKKLIESIEDLGGFEGWENFANTWDFKLVPPERTLAIPLVVVWKKFGEVKEWDATVDRLAKKPGKAKATATLKGPIPNSVKNKGKKKK